MLKFISSKEFFLPIIYIIVGIIVFKIISGIITRITNVTTKEGKSFNKKKRTINSLIKNLIKYIIAVIVVIAILNVYGINTISLVAGLSIVGAVLGLAFEDLVKDLIAGVTIIFDNHYEVGDYISVNGFLGEVVSVGLKTTKIKSYNGDVKIINNSAFNEVINYSISDYRLILDIPISYNQNIEVFENKILEIESELLSIEGAKSLKLLGINSYNDSSMSYAVEITCKAMSQYRVRRQGLKIIKNKLDKEKISIPYNVLDVNINK